MFTTREVATAIWLVIICVLLLLKADVRASVTKVIRAFFAKPIVVSMGLMFLYNVIVIAGLNFWGFWNISFLKDTVIWFLFAAIPLTLSFASSKEEVNVFRKILVENFKALIVVEYVVATYTFPLLVELMLFPVLLFIGLLDVVAKSDKKYVALARITSVTLPVLGLGILFFSIYGAAMDYQNLFSLGTVFSLFLTPMLSLLFAPFVFFLVLYARYESLFVLLNMGSKKPANIKGYAKRQIIKRLRLSLKGIREFHRSNGRKLIQVKTKDDVDRLFQEN
jgi:hypothetical protein